jgi:hypothetical protein
MPGRGCDLIVTLRQIGYFRNGRYPSGSAQEYLLQGQRGLRRDRMWLGGERVMRKDNFWPRGLPGEWP